MPETQNLEIQTGGEAETQPGYYSIRP